MTDPDTSGGITALTVLSPVRAVSESELEELLQGLPGGEGSPLAKPGTTHFARLIVLRDLQYQGPPQHRDHLRSAYLLLVSSCDGDVRDYLHALVREAPEEVGTIWSHCVGNPGIEDADAFVDYVLAGRVRSAFFFAAYQGLTVPDVRRVLALREQVREFAVTHQDSDDETLHKAFLDEFARQP